MATALELVEGLHSLLTSDSLVGAAVSAVISPEGRNLAAQLVQGIADLESRHEAAKAAAVADAHEQGHGEGLADAAIAAAQSAAQNPAEATS